MDPETALSCTFPSLVRIEHQDRAVRELLQQFEVRLTERGAVRRDRFRDPGLVQGDHVRVSLDDDRYSPARDRRLRSVEAEHRA